jgi:hypothetical protein
MVGQPEQGAGNPSDAFQKGKRLKVAAYCPEFFGHRAQTETCKVKVVNQSREKTSLLKTVISKIL